jgi:hypothetical protein
MPITVAAWSEVRTVFARSINWIVGSNPNRGTDVYVRLLSVCVVLCAGSGLCDGLIPRQRCPADCV